jgi:hypothetical protein
VQKVGGVGRSLGWAARLPTMLVTRSESVALRTILGSIGPERRTLTTAKLDRGDRVQEGGYCQDLGSDGSFRLTPSRLEVYSPPNRYLASVAVRL